MVAPLAERVPVGAVLREPDAVAPAASLDDEVVRGRGGRNEGQQGEREECRAHCQTPTVPEAPGCGVIINSRPATFHRSDQHSYPHARTGGPAGRTGPERPCARRRAARRLPAVVAGPRRVAARARGRRVVGVAPGPAGPALERHRAGGAAGRDRALRAGHARALRALAPPARRRGRRARPRRHVRAHVRRLHGQQRAARARGRRDPDGPDGAARTDLDADRGRHAAGRAAARRRRARGDLRGRRLRPARGGRGRQGRDHRAGGRRPASWLGCWRMRSCAATTGCSTS